MQMGGTYTAKLMKLWYEAKEKQYRQARLQLSFIGTRPDLSSCWQIAFRFRRTRWEHLWKLYPALSRHFSMPLPCTRNHTDGPWEAHCVVVILSGGSPREKARNTGPSPCFTSRGVSRLLLFIDCGSLKAPSFVRVIIELNSHVQKFGGWRWITRNTCTVGSARDRSMAETAQYRVQASSWGLRGRHNIYTLNISELHSSTITTLGCNVILSHIVNLRSSWITQDG